MENISKIEQEKRSLMEQYEKDEAILKNPTKELICHWCKEKIEFDADNDYFYRCIIHNNIFCIKCYEKIGEFTPAEFAKCKQQIRDKKECIAVKQHGTF